MSSPKKQVSVGAALEEIQRCHERAHELAGKFSRVARRWPRLPIPPALHARLMSNAASAQVLAEGFRPGDVAMAFAAVMIDCFLKGDAEASDPDLAWADFCDMADALVGPVPQSEPTVGQGRPVQTDHYLRQRSRRGRSVQAAAVPRR